MFAGLTFGVWLLLEIFVKKKRQNARGFAREFLCSCKGYGPGRSVKRCGKSSSALEKNFFVSEGVLGHLGPLYLALGTNRLMVVFR